MFLRAHHNLVLEALRDLDGDVFAGAQCFFGGGTAITLALGEYRESIDIDFLCASQDGYRILREAVSDAGFSGLTREGSSLEAIRDLRTNQYGIRTILGVGEARIKFEIIREARIEIAGNMNDDYGVPVLEQTDMYAEKLLANADRWRDRATMSRDIIDLSMMISRWGPIPDSAWEKVTEAYGKSARTSYANAVNWIKDPAHLVTCMKAMQMDMELADEILVIHGGPKVQED